MFPKLLAAVFYLFQNDLVWTLHDSKNYMQENGNFLYISITLHLDSICFNWRKLIERIGMNKNYHLH